MAENQSTQHQSTQPLIPDAGKAINAEIKSAEMPENWDKGQRGEYDRRMQEALSRYLGDKYVHAIQTEQKFDLQKNLDGISPKETPDDIHKRSAAIENRIQGTGSEKIEPGVRLTNGAEDQGSFLESASRALKTQEKPNMAGIEAGAKRNNLTTTDVANYAQLQGIKVPDDVVHSLRKMESDAKAHEATGNTQQAGTQEHSAAPQKIARSR